MTRFNIDNLAFYSFKRYFKGHRSFIDSLIPDFFTLVTPYPASLFFPLIRIFPAFDTGRRSLNFLPYTPEFSEPEKNPVSY